MRLIITVLMVVFITKINSGQNCSDLLDTYSTFESTTKEELISNLVSQYETLTASEKYNAKENDFTLGATVPINGVPIPIDIGFSNIKSEWESNLKNTLDYYEESNNFTFNQKIVSKFLPTSAYPTYLKCLKISDENKPVELIITKTIHYPLVTITIHTKLGGVDSEIGEVFAIVGGKKIGKDELIATGKLKNNDIINNTGITITFENVESTDDFLFYLKAKSYVYPAIVNISRNKVTSPIIYNKSIPFTNKIPRAGADNELVKILLLDYIGREVNITIKPKFHTLFKDDINVSVNYAMLYTIGSERYISNFKVANNEERTDIGTLKTVVPENGLVTIFINHNFPPDYKIDDEVEPTQIYFNFTQVDIDIILEAN